MYEAESAQVGADKSKMTKKEKHERKLIDYENWLLKNESSYRQSVIVYLLIIVFLVSSIFFYPEDHLDSDKINWTFIFILFSCFLIYRCRLKIKHIDSILLYRDKNKKLEYENKNQQSGEQQNLATLRSPDMIIEEILDSKYHNRPLSHRITK